MADEPFLFHCFPSKFGALNNREIGSAQNVNNDVISKTVGLEILRSTLSSGLLLTTESVPVARLPGSEQADYPPIKIEQSRACFTLATCESLTQPNPFLGHSHLDVFGYFGIGLDPIAARDFEMCPVTYYYAPNEEQQHYPLSSANVHALIEVREILSQLTLLEAKQDLSDYPTTSRYRDVEPFFEKAGVGLLHQPPERLSKLNQRCEKISANEIRPVLECLQTDKRPLWQLVEAIDLITGLYQTADSSSLGASMYYYSQLEWRITKSLAPSFLGTPLTETLQVKDATLRKHIDDARMEKLDSIANISEICNDNFTPNQLGDLYLVIGNMLTGKRIRDYVEVILCPKILLPDVQTLVSNISRNLVHKIRFIGV